MVAVGFVLALGSIGLIVHVAYSIADHFGLVAMFYEYLAALVVGAIGTALMRD